MALDPTTDIGKVRLRVGDYFDLPIFPDSVYTAALTDNGGNLLRASKLMAQYILGALTMRVHEKMAQLEVFGNQYVDNYVKFLTSTILNPALMEVAPVPYGSGLDTTHPLIQFQKDWNAFYVAGTEDDHAKFLLAGDNNGLF